MFYDLAATPFVLHSLCSHLYEQVVLWSPVPFIDPQWPTTRIHTQIPRNTFMMTMASNQQHRFNTAHTDAYLSLMPSSARLMKMDPTIVLYVRPTTPCTID